MNTQTERPTTDRYLVMPLDVQIRRQRATLKTVRRLAELFGQNGKPESAKGATAHADLIEKKLNELLAEEAGQG